MISYQLAGKTALVTGGASGIGFATASMLAKFGATVAVNFLPDDPRGPEAVEKLIDAGGKAIMAPGSVGDADDAPRMVQQAVKDLGRLDLLFANAGTPGTRNRIVPAQLDLITEDLWQTLLQVNLLGVFRCAKAAAESRTWCDCQHRLHCRSRPSRQQPGLWRDQGGGRQLDPEPGPRTGAGGSRECDRPGGRR
jgi:3-oxoacyl-[acyl-carrier protein] reductase